MEHPVSETDKTDGESISDIETLEAKAITNPRVSPDKTSSCNLKCKMLLSDFCLFLYTYQFCYISEPPIQTPTTNQPKSIGETPL